MPAFILTLWPLVAVLIFASLNFRRALICSVVWGHLFLPEKFSLNVAGLPPYDKNAAVSLGVLLGYLIFRKTISAELTNQREQNGKKWRKIDLLIGVLLFVQLLSPVFTYLNNASPIFYGNLIVNAVTPWDLPSSWFSSLVIFIPYLISAKVLTREEDHAEVLKILVFSGIFYSLLILFEARMSPQLHVWVYGYFQHEFIQHVRGGNFRPIVFLPHGLWIGFFLFTVLISSAALVRKNDFKRTVIWIFATLWLCLVLIISRNFGAMFLALLFVPVILLTKPNLQIRLSAIIGLLFLLYPTLRQLDVVPLDRISATTSQFSTERTNSFEFRVKHEDALLAHSSLKPYFGWGDWGRARIFDENGKDLTTADGIWIIILGTRGLVGYASFFGLLVIPVVLLGLGNRSVPVRAASAGLAIIMGGNFIYMVPNSVLSPIGWMLAGAILGYLRNEPKKNHRSANERRQYIQYSRPKKSKQQSSGYSRERL